VQRSKGTSASTLAPIWKEAETYESTTKRLSTRTATLDGQASPWVTSYAYDSNGRDLTTTYPSGLVVKKGYATYGDLNQLSDNTAGTVFWTATAKDAWGNVTAESYVGNITGSHSAYASTGQIRQKSWSSGATLLDQLSYSYDSLGNLAGQTTVVAASPYSQSSESYGYDALQRLTQTSRTVATCTAVPPSGTCTASTPPPATSYAYTPAGSLSSKSDFSTNTPNAYTYGTNGCGPHAASQVVTPSGTVTYQCDANGNVTGGSTLTAIYDFQNLPWQITRSGAGQAAFEYDANGNRFREQATSESTWFGTDGYEVSFNNPQTTYRHELGPVTVSKVGALYGWRANLRDRLGSTIAMGSANGTLWQTRAYDAFGKVRNGDFSDRTNGTLNLQVPTLRGFTGHEHVDDVQLIHMNGRVYDYQLGRFLSVDPIIGNPLSSQSLNPYSYIGNNPLSGTDPTGYEACTGSHIDRNDGSSCSDQGVSGGGSNSPSKDQQMQALSAKMMNIAASHWNQHMDAMTAKGAASTPTSGSAADIGASGKTVGNEPGAQESGLRTTFLEGMTVTPSEDERFDAWRRQDTNDFLLTPVTAAIGFATGTNPWHENAPGDDSIQPATLPGAWGMGIKGAAVGLGILRDAVRVEEAYGVLSDMPLEAQRFLSSGRETQVYLGARNGETVYCGISCNVAARQIQHGTRFDIQSISPMMPRGQARAIEQAMIVRNPQFENIRNSISPSHAYYNDVVRWGENWLQENGH
jgi:RHS repeat-associated protein